MKQELSVFHAADAVVEKIFLQELDRSLK